MSILLDVKNLGISFGGLRAVNEFDLTIQKGTALWSDRTKWCRKDDRI